jgi:hypothetical protein
MGRPTLALAAVLGLAATPAAPVEPETAAPGWILETRAGERLAGELRGLDDHVRWRDSEKDQEYVLTTAETALLHRRSMPEPPPVVDLLELWPGDRLACTAVTLDAGVLTADLAMGTALRIPHAAAKALLLRQSGERNALRGLGRLQDWLGGSRNWLASNAGFTAQEAPAVLARRLALSERVRITLALSAALPRDLWLYVFTDAVAPPAGDGYALHLAGDAVTFERHYALGAARLVGACRLPSGGAADQTVLTLTADLPQRHFSLATPEEACGTWLDGGGDAPTGRGLLLVCLAAPVTICDLRITGLDDCIPEDAGRTLRTTDRVTLANGDQAEGRIVAISATAWDIQRPGAATPQRLPATAVRSALFRTPAQPLPRRTGIAVQLTDGSLLHATHVQFRAGRLDIRSDVWGPKTVPIADVAAIRFPEP